MILAYLEADKLLCAVWIGTKPADSASSSALFAICSVTATMIFNTGKYENWIPYYIKENYSYHDLNANTLNGGFTATMLPWGHTVVIHEVTQW